MSTKKKVKNYKEELSLSLYQRSKLRWKNEKKTYKVATIVLAIIGIFASISLINHIRIDIKYGDAWHIKELNLDKAWISKSGKNQTIAFLDTGMSVELQEQYSGRIVSPYNIITESSDVVDTNGHGTSMICAATCDYNKSGIYGVAHKADVMPVVVVDESGSSSGEILAKGIEYAVNNNADIINLSIGSRIENDLVKEAINKAEQRNIIVVAAVGDYSDDRILYPAAYDSTISVSSQSKLGVKYKNASYNEDVDFLIPGEFIKTLTVIDNKLEVDFESGSSVSTALMSGIMALRLETTRKDYDHTLNHAQEFEQKTTFLNVNKFKGGILSVI